MNQVSELKNRFERMNDEGLLHIAFSVDGKPDLETVAKEVNSLYKAVDSGHCEVLDFGDSSR